MYDLKLSKLIFQELTSARIINNKILIKGDTWVENPLYSEIITNIEQYKQQYEMCGYELSLKAGFIHLQPSLSDNTTDDLNKRIPLLFMLISRNMLIKGYRFEKIDNVLGGITPDEIEEIGALDETKEWLEKAEFGKMDFKKAIKLTLVDRNLMVEKDNGNIILSTSGSVFFEELFLEHKKDISKID